DRTGRYDDVDHALLDQIRDDLAHPRGDERPGHAQEDRGPVLVAEHRVEDRRGFAERAGLERGFTVAVEQLGDRCGLADFYRRRRTPEELLLPLAVDADRRGVDVLLGA